MPVRFLRLCLCTALQRTALWLVRCTVCTLCMTNMCTTGCYVMSFIQWSTRQAVDLDGVDVPQCMFWEAKLQQRILAFESF